MTYDKESCYKKYVDEERRCDKSVDKPTLTPTAPQKVRGAQDVVNLLCPINHVGMRKVGHSKGFGFESEIRATNANVHSLMGMLIEVILADRTC